MLAITRSVRERERQAVAQDAAPSLDGCYQRYSQQVFRWALRYGAGSSGWAEDLTHDVFLRLMLALPKLTDHGDLAGWLYRATANLALTRLAEERSWVRRLQHTLGLERERTVSGPDVTFEHKESAALALDGLRALPAAERVAMTMLVLDGRSQTEIAELLGLSKGYVSKLVARGWERLREAGWEVRR